MDKIALPRKILISAGPMRTELDSVRFVQNRSSGRMGLELARAAKRWGAQVTVLLGPVDASIANEFKEFELERYTTPGDYGAKLEKLFLNTDAFFSAAAVLDFELVAHPGKLEREALARAGEIRLPLREVPDFVARMGRLKKSHQKVIAFAAESGTESEILARAEKKMLKKSADALIANPVWPGLGPEVEQNRVWILRPDRPVADLGAHRKSELAEPILELIFSSNG